MGKNDIERRLVDITCLERPSLTSLSSVGEQTTAKLLCENRFNKKKLAYTWIASCLWTLLRESSLPDYLLGYEQDVYRTTLFHKIKFEQLEFYWHHSTKVGIPLSISYHSFNEEFEKGFTLDNYKHLVQWAIKETILFNSKYTVIKIINK